MGAGAELIVGYFTAPLKLRRNLQPLITQRQWSKGLRAIAKWTLPQNNEGRAWVVGWELSLLFRSSLEDTSALKLDPLAQELLGFFRQGAEVLHSITDRDSLLNRTHFVHEYQSLFSTVLDVLVQLGYGPTVGEICNEVGNYILSVDEAYRELLFAGMGYMLADAMAFGQEAKPWPLRKLLSRMSYLSRLCRAQPGLPYVVRATETLREIWCLTYEAALMREEPRLTDEEEKGANVRIGIAAKLLDELKEEWECLRGAPLKQNKDRDFARMITALYWCRLRLWLLREAKLEIIPLHDAQGALEDIFKAAARDLEPFNLEREALDAWRVEVVSLAVKQRKFNTPQEKIDFASGALKPIMSQTLSKYEAWPLVLSMELFGYLTGEFNDTQERSERLNLFFHECLRKDSLEYGTRLSALARFVGELPEESLTDEHGMELVKFLSDVAPLGTKRLSVVYSDIRGLVVQMSLSKQRKALRAMKKGLCTFLGSIRRVVEADGGILKAETAEVCKFIALARTVVQIDCFLDDEDLKIDPEITNFVLGQLEALWEHLQVGPVDMLQKWLWSYSFAVIEPFLMLAVEAEFLDASLRGVVDSAAIDMNTLLKQFLVDLLQSRLAIDPIHLCPSLVLLLTVSEVYLGNLKEWRGWMNLLSIRSIQEDSLRWLRESSLTRWMFPPYTAPQDDQNRIKFKQSYASSIFETFGLCSFEDVSGMVTTYRLLADNAELIPNADLLRCIKAQPQDREGCESAARKLEGRVCLTFLDDLSPLLADASYQQKPSFLLPDEHFRATCSKQEQIRQVVLHGARGISELLKRLCTEPRASDRLNLKSTRERLSPTKIIHHEFVSATAKDMQVMALLPWNSSSLSKPELQELLEAWDELRISKRVYLPARTFLDPFIDPARADRTKIGKWTVPMINEETALAEQNVWVVPGAMERTTKVWVEHLRNNL